MTSFQADVTWNKTAKLCTLRAFQLAAISDTEICPFKHVILLIVLFLFSSVPFKETFKINNICCVACLSYFRFALGGFDASHYVE